MYEDLGFQGMCRRVRFTLDEPYDDADGRESLLADFVARVRSTGLQVTRRTVPEVHSAIVNVSQSLRVLPEPEVYVVNDPESNAFAPAFASDDRPIIVLNSGLVTLLDTNELAFAVAHELGHLGLRHASRILAAEPRSEFEALQMRSRQRYAEVSADRVGLLATRSLFTAARVMVKLASGLPTAALGLDVDAFVQQIERDPSEVSRSWELEQSHPSLPCRLWALLRFVHSDTYAMLSGQGDSGLALSAIDSEISHRFAEMGDGRLSDMESSIYNIALVWAGAAMILEDDVIEPCERQALIRLVGEEHARKAIEFAETQGRASVIAKLADAIERINAASTATRLRFHESVRVFSVSLDVPPEETQAGQLLERALRLR